MNAEVLNDGAYRGRPTIAGSFRVAQSRAKEIFRSVSRRLSVRREECRARSRISGQLTPFTNQLFEPFEPLESRGCRGVGGCRHLGRRISKHTIERDGCREEEGRDEPGSPVVKNTLAEEGSRAERAEIERRG